MSRHATAAEFQARGCAIIRFQGFPLCIGMFGLAAPRRPVARKPLAAGLFGA